MAVLERRRILVVEDDPDARELASEFLRMHGCEVREARDGLEALQAAEGGYRPHAIVLDLMMPRLDGREFLARFRHLPGSAEVEVVIASAAPHLARDLRVKATLAKPYDPEDLLSALTR